MERLDDKVEHVGGLDQRPDVEAGDTVPWPNFDPPKMEQQSGVSSLGSGSEIDARAASFSKMLEDLRAQMTPEQRRIEEAHIEAAPVNWECEGGPLHGER